MKFASIYHTFLVEYQTFWFLFILTHIIYHFFLWWVQHAKSHTNNFLFVINNCIKIRSFCVLTAGEIILILQAWGQQTFSEILNFFFDVIEKQEDINNNTFYYINKKNGSNKKQIWIEYWMVLPYIIFWLEMRCYRNK